MRDVAQAVFRGGRLATYLNDHLAGATGGVRLARRVASDAHGTADEPTLAAVAEEIAVDRATLEDVMRRLDVQRSQFKRLTAWCAEQARRALPHSWLLDRSGLGHFEQIEMLELGVTGKLALWRALATARAVDPRLQGIDFETLAGRASSQRDRLERVRLRLAGEMLGPDRPRRD